jgi:hypothetical protein
VALVASGDPGAVLEALEELHPSDIADLVEELEDDRHVQVPSPLLLGLATALAL